MDREGSWELTRNIEGMSEERAAEIGKKNRDHWWDGENHVQKEWEDRSGMKMIGEDSGY